MTSDYNWWVSGGLDKDENPLKTSEVRWLNGTWTPGPVLPTKVYGHCVTQIQRQKSVIIGGYPSHDNYIYDWITKVSRIQIKKNLFFIDLLIHVLKNPPLRSYCLQN